MAMVADDQLATRHHNQYSALPATGGDSGRHRTVILKLMARKLVLKSGVMLCAILVLQLHLFLLPDVLDN
jgi:hypothetical protein